MNEKMQISTLECIFMEWTMMLKVLYMPIYTIFEFQSRAVEMQLMPNTCHPSTVISHTLEKNANTYFAKMHFLGLFILAQSKTYFV